MSVLSGSGGMLPSLSALDKYSSDHLMSSLGFSHYTTIGVRKLPEGNHLSGSSSHPTSLSPIPNYSSMVTSPSPVTTILAPVTTHATYSTTMAPSSSSTTSANPHRERRGRPQQTGKQNQLQNGTADH